MWCMTLIHRQPVATLDRRSCTVHMITTGIWHGSQALLILQGRMQCSQPVAVPDTQQAARHTSANLGSVLLSACGHKTSRPMGSSLPCWMLVLLLLSLELCRGPAINYQLHGTAIADTVARTCCAPAPLLQPASTGSPFLPGFTSDALAR